MADAAAIAAWQRIMSLVYIVLLSTVILILFSDIFGVADRVVVALNGGRTIRSSLGGIGALIFCLMYVFDFSYWPGTLGKICRRIGVLLVLCFVVATAVVSQAAFAWAPLAVSIMLLPFLLVFMITTVFGSVKQNLPGVASWLGVALLLTSAYVVVLWALWFSGALHGEAVQYWGSQKAVFAAAAQCNRRDEDTGRFTHSGVTTLADGTVVCLAAMILWASPLILAAVLFFLGLFTLLLGRSLRQSSGSASLLKLTAAVLFTCFIGIYAAGGVGGASVGVSTAALAIFCVLLVSTVVLVGAVIGFDSLQTRVSSHPVMLKLHDAVSGPFLEWVQALFAFFGVVPFCAFLALSFVNQLVRKADREATCVQFAKDIQNEKTGHLTTLANRQLAYMATWSWTAVLGKAQIIGYLVWGSYYGVTLTYIVLNFVISALISVHWAAVSAIFFATGLIMFLIPVVPGTAVYLTGGVLLVPVCEAAWSGCNAGGACAVANATLVNGSASVTSVVADCSTTSGGTFWLAIIWAGFLTYVLKFIAHVCQHKWFGEGCGRSVAVRAAVGPNSTIMKSIRLILEAKGVTPAKACIMCGGPDWPTSVICGMLRIPLAGSSLGLVPIFIFTFPVVIAGAFQTKTVEPYSNLFPLALLFVMVLNLVFTLGLMYYTNKVITEQAEELAAVPDDEEVKQLDEAKAATAAARAAATRFQDSPMWVRALLVLCTVLLMLSAYCLVFMKSRLFQPFKLTDCRDYLGQSPYDYIQAVGASPLGAVALGCLFASIALKIVLNQWAGSVTKAALSSVAPSRAPPSPSGAASASRAYAPAASMDEKLAYVEAPPSPPSPVDDGWSLR